MESAIDSHSHLYIPLLSLAFYFRDRLTKTALRHHLSILNIVGGLNMKQMSRPLTLLAKYKDFKGRAEKVYVCSKVIYRTFQVQLSIIKTRFSIFR